MKQKTKRIISTLLAGVICALSVPAAAAPASAASYNSGGVICDDQLGDGHIVF